jgi:hypothetical protein
MSNTTIANKCAIVKHREHSAHVYFFDKTEPLHIGDSVTVHICETNDKTALRIDYNFYTHKINITQL